MEVAEEKSAEIACRSPAGGGRVFPHLCSPSPVRLTVWCKSLLFNSAGYTVYDDSDGRMIFRVENYAQDRRQETMLMDFAGNVLLTISPCRKILSMIESWEVYKGERAAIGSVGRQRPLFKATKDLGNPSCTVNLMPSTDGGEEPIAYRTRWSRHGEGGLKIYPAMAVADASLVAEVSRKYADMHNALLDKDVLTLMVQPGMDQAIAMAIIIITNLMR